MTMIVQFILIMGIIVVDLSNGFSFGSLSQQQPSTIINRRKEQQFGIKRNKRNPWELFISKTAPPTDSSSSSNTNTNNNDDSVPNYNAVPVAKTGGRGVSSASVEALKRDLSLGAPRSRPTGGHYLTRGGIQVTANVQPLRFVSPAEQQQQQQQQQQQEDEEKKESMEKGTSVRMIEDLIDALDSHKGVLLESSYEFPGRYARWSLGFIDPPIEIIGMGSKCSIRALNARGRILLPSILQTMNQLKQDNILEQVEVIYSDDDDDDAKEEPVCVNVIVVPPSKVGTFSEEERSRQPSLFSVVRSLINLFAYEGGDGQLGLYGAFGYDLTFQFEPITLSQIRDMDQRDLVLYLPDHIVVVDQDKRDAWTISYDFCCYNNNNDGGGKEMKTTQGLSRTGDHLPFIPYHKQQQQHKNDISFQSRDTPPKEFATSVQRAKEEFKVGNLFEVVLSQTFRQTLGDNNNNDNNNGDNEAHKKTLPSTLYRRLRERNPSPYGFFIHLGMEEYLVGASPEMFVRCERISSSSSSEASSSSSSSSQPSSSLLPPLRVETCPISGTVARGADALEDAKRVKSLMMNAKEESELTMCTDVDRNDKSRICVPGSVKVIGRRQIEMYSRLIHTVDHVEGYLRPEFDALDAFLCHTWAVTVTGAPKTWAIQFVEDNERSPRCWYGGAVGMVGFDGSLNTGLTLRTVRIKNGIAEVRAGATLLYDSDPIEEEYETELKASAMIDAIVVSSMDDTKQSSKSSSSANNQNQNKTPNIGQDKSIILIDHEDSFVHTLGNYLRQTGAIVKTLRSGPLALSMLKQMIDDGNKPDMVVLSPGPGTPTDFALSTTIDFLISNDIPGFGVCLGLQGMVEHFGGTLGIMSYPMHGKPSKVTLTSSGKKDDSIFVGLPDTFEVARYHSLFGEKDKLPSSLEVTALSDDGIVMGIQHTSLPMAAVQFHPESILTSPTHGMKILENAMKFLTKKKKIVTD